MPNSKRCSATSAWASQPPIRRAETWSSTRPRRRPSRPSRAGSRARSGTRYRRSCERSTRCELAEVEAFLRADVEAATAAPQVGFLKSAARSAPPGTESDLLVALGTELHWLPLRGVGRTELDLDGVEAAVGPMTVRSLNTIRRIAGRFG